MRREREKERKKRKKEKSLSLDFTLSSAAKLLKTFFSSGPRLVHHSPKILVMFRFSRLGYFSLTIDRCSVKKYCIAKTDFFRTEFFLLSSELSTYQCLTELARFFCAEVKVFWEMARESRRKGGREQGTGREVKHR